MQEVVSLLLLWLSEAGLGIEINSITGVSLEASPVQATKRMWNVFIAAKGTH